MRRPDRLGSVQFRQQYVHAGLFRGGRLNATGRPQIGAASDFRLYFGPGHVTSGHVRHQRSQRLLWFRADCGPIDRLQNGRPLTVVMIARLSTTVGRNRISNETWSRHKRNLFPIDRMRCL